MRRSVFLVILVFSLILGACAPAATAVPTAAPTATLSIPTATIDLTPSATAAPSATPEPTIEIIKSDPATCQVAPVIPQPDPGAQTYLPAVTSDEWKTGAENPVVTIIEYGDFQDANSAKLSVILQQLIEKYPEDVQVVFRHFPLPEQYDKDQLAAQAAEAAGLQGKF